MTTIKTYTALVNELNNRVTLSVQNVAQTVCNKLRKCIDEGLCNCSKYCQTNTIYKGPDSPDYTNHKPGKGAF